jgi:hypothetical protein
MTRFRFVEAVGHGAGEQLLFHFFERVAGVPELAGRVKEFAIPRALGSTVLEVVKSASGQRWPG